MYHVQRQTIPVSGNRGKGGGGSEVLTPLQEEAYKLTILEDKGVPDLSRTCDIPGYMNRKERGKREIIILYYTPYPPSNHLGRKQVQCYSA